MFLCNRLDREQSNRKLLQDELDALHRVNDQANLARAELEQQLERLRAELQELQQIHQQASERITREVTSCLLHSDCVRTFLIDGDNSILLLVRMPAPSTVRCGAHRWNNMLI